MLRRLLFAPFCLVTAFVTAYAQSNYATVRGSVFDPQHHAIVGAHIHAKEASTGAEREVVSNATGLYEIAGLQPGTYTLTVDSQGFAQASQNVVLEVGQQATLDIALRVNKESQTVTVAASGELLKTQDASVGEVVDQRSVDSLPLNGRMLIDLRPHGAGSAHQSRRGDRRHEPACIGVRDNDRQSASAAAVPTGITFCSMARPIPIRPSARRT